MTVTPQPFKVFTANDHKPLPSGLIEATEEELAVATVSPVPKTKSAPKAETTPKASPAQRRSVVPRGQTPETFTGLPLHRYRCTLYFQTSILGSASSNPDIYRDYIASKAPPGTETDSEVDLLPTSEQPKERPTVFRVKKDLAGVEHPILLGYMIKGFFTEACKQLRDCGEPTFSAELTSFKKDIAGKLDICPYPLGEEFPESERDDKRSILIHYDGEIGYNQRPLRADTPQGTRVALTSSQEIGPGAWVEFEIVVLGSRISENVLREWLTYGEIKGAGQWRNGGHGKFTFELDRLS